MKSPTSYATPTPFDPVLAQLTAARDRYLNLQSDLARLGCKSTISLSFSLDSIPTTGGGKPVSSNPKRSYNRPAPGERAIDYMMKAFKAKGGVRISRRDLFEAMKEQGWRSSSLTPDAVLGACAAANPTLINKVVENGVIYYEPRFAM